MLRRVPVTRVDYWLHIFALLIAHFELSAIGGDEFYLQLAIAPVQLAVSRMVGNRVFVADVLPDAVEDFPKFLLEAREIRASARHAGEGVHLVIGLQVIHLANGNTHAVGVSAGMHFAI